MAYKDRIPDVIDNDIRTGYSKTPNSITRNCKLSDKSKCVLTYLLGNKPEGWSTELSHLSSITNRSKSSAKKALIELEDNGYLIRLVRRNKKKQIDKSYMAYSYEPWKFSNLDKQIEEIESKGFTVSIRPHTIARFLKKDNVTLQKLTLRFKLSGSDEKPFDSNKLADLLASIIRLRDNNDSVGKELNTKVLSIFSLAPSAHSIGSEIHETNPSYQEQQGDFLMNENLVFSRNKPISPTKATPLPIEANRQTGTNMLPVEPQAVIVAPPELPPARRCPMDMRRSYDGDAHDIISYWNNCGLAKIEKKSGQYASSLRILKEVMSGAFFQDKTDYMDTNEGKKIYTKEEILNEIKNRMLSATDNDYMPTSVKEKERIRKLPMDRWFYMGHIRSGSRSQFIQWFGRKPQLSNGVCKVEDEAPEYTKALKKLFEVRVTSDKPIDGKWSASNEGKFRMAAIRTKEYFEARRRRINSWCKNTPEEQCRWVFEAIKVDVGDDYKGVGPGWLGSNETFEVRLPRYLNNQAILRSSTEDEKPQVYEYVQKVVYEIPENERFDRELRNEGQYAE